MAEESKFYTAQLDKKTMILSKNADQQIKIINQIAKAQQDALDQHVKAVAAAEEKVRQMKLVGNADELAQAKAALSKEYEAKEIAEAEFQKAKRDAQIQAEKIATQYELNSYRAKTAIQKFEYNQTLADNLRAEQKAQEEKQKMLTAAIQQETDAVKKAGLRNQLVRLGQEKEVTKQHLAEVTNRNKQLSRLPFNRKKTLDARDKDAQARLESSAESLLTAQATKESIVRTDEYINQEKKLQQLKKTGTQEEITEAQNELKRMETAAKASDEYQAAEQQEAEATHQLMMAGFDKLGTSVEKTVDKVKSKVMDKAVSSIEGNLDAMFGAQGRMMGRLQGSAVDWAKTVDSVSDTIGFSGIVSKKSVVAKMVDLVDSGVAYNLEMRAFLAETSQNIASTFSATNGTLLRLIRLQQADTTAARLGMEAALTDLFNKYFEDTSYLAGDIADEISAALLDANATMTRDQSLAFEYTVQKWLGSLYSLGMSSDTVSSIASGINYLTTGNVNALSQNESLATLLTMGAARAGGKSYSDMLLTGITPNETNNLLRGIIELLADISNNQTNYVTKSAYADLFGMSITDLSTFASLTTTDIQNLYNSTESYSSLMQETENQLSQIANRINMSQLVDTAIDNALVGAAANIGSNPITYGTWKALGILKEYVGEINVPGILALGNGVSSSIDLINVAQTGLVGMGLLGSLLEGVMALGNGGVTNLDNWKFSEYTQRGSGLKILDIGALTTTSYSAQLGVGSTSSDDMSSISLQNAVDTAYSAAGTSSEELQEQKDTIQEIYNVLGGDTPSVLSVLQEIDDRLDPGRVFYTASAGVFTTEAAQRLTNLSAQIQASGHTWLGSVVNSQPVATAEGGTSTTQSGSASTISIADTEGLTTIINDAVQQAINAVLSQYSTGNGIPVTLANGGLYS